ncbi:MAG: sensor histidine kinase [Burkholderiales bacterium]
MSGKLLSAPERLAVANPQWSLALMLLALHGAIAWGIEDWWSRAFLLVHFGLFLLWQPVWRGEREVEPRQAVIVVVAAVLLVGWLNWWLTAVWDAVLFGLIGGSIPRLTERRQRLVSVFAAAYLLSMLLIWVVPHLFNDQVIEPLFEILVRYGLAVLPLAILLVRLPVERHQTPVGVDLIYSLLFFLLVVSLVLGSFVMREASQGNYATALAQTLLGIGGLLVGLSWLWSPHAGFAGIGYLLSSYFMTLGLPFERWVQRLAELAQEETNPQRFLSQGVQHMLDMPWVRGVQWQAAGAAGACGTRTAHATEVASDGLKLTIHTRWPVSPAVLLHLKLLAQMVGHFYEAKQREQAQRQSAYAHAIYETGARLTHDVKNLLQSLKSLCAAAASTTPEQSAALQRLIQRQLPQITQRLNTTLDKLTAPHYTPPKLVAAGSWWENLLQRYAGRRIQFTIDGDIERLEVPLELFDSVADNLIENALHKDARTGGVHVRVTFSAAPAVLTVCDDGAAIAKGLAAQLFAAPVASLTGFGVGLYQSSRLASQHGYRLMLTANEPGRVCFTLSAESVAEAARPHQNVA